MANTSEVCPESIQPCAMKKEEDTRKSYTGQGASVPFKVGTLGPHIVFPVTISCLIVFF